MSRLPNSRNTLLLKQQTKKNRNNSSKTGAYKTAFILPLCKYTERIKRPIKNVFMSRPHSNKIHTSKIFMALPKHQ